MISQRELGVEIRKEEAVKRKGEFSGLTFLPVSSSRHSHARWDRKQSKRSARGRGKGSQRVEVFGE